MDRKREYRYIWQQYHGTQPRRLHIGPVPYWQKKPRKASKEFNTKLLTLPNTHTVKGRTTFFDNISDCHRHLTQLKVNIPNYEDLIDITLSAFDNSILIPRDLKEIEYDWDKALTAEKWKEAKLWSKFKDFYTKKLTNIKVDN